MRDLANRESRTPQPLVLSPSRTFVPVVRETTEINPKEIAPADFPTLRDQLDTWRARLVEVGWVPWVILAVAIFLRLFLLGIKPPHFDEGINGWFVDEMVKDGYYKYDPTNYHGPLHFYVLFLSEALFGRNVWALRLPVVLGSIACVWLCLKFEPFVGRNASRIAALAMAVSPGFIFYGRYSIHEAWLVLFSMMFILGLLGLWKFGKANYLWSAGIGVAGMILTKETYIIHIGCALIAIPMLMISNALNPVPDSKPVRQTWTAVDLIMLCAVGVGAIVFFYSGTFFHWSGVKGLYRAFAPWFSTGSEGHGHEKPWLYWLELVLRYEWPVFIGLTLCLACQFFNNLVIRYFAIYGVGILAAYSIIHYKTPWIIISIAWPFLFVFAAGTAALKIPRKAFYAVGGAVLGFGLGGVISYFIQAASAPQTCSMGIYLNEAIKLTLTAGSTSGLCGQMGGTLYGCAIVSALAGSGLGLWLGQSARTSERLMQAVQRVTAAIALLFSLEMAIWLNYFRCTTDTEPYVYVQTYNDIYKFTDPLLELASRDPAAYHLKGLILRPSPYPLPWMLGDFSAIGYYEHENMPGTLVADFLLVEEDRISQVESKLQGSYYTETLKIRAYQDTSKAYFRAKIFKPLFPNREPEFNSKNPANKSAQQ